MWVASLNGDSQAYLVQGVRIRLVKNNVEKGKVVKAGLPTGSGCQELGRIWLARAVQSWLEARREETWSREGQQRSSPPTKQPVYILSAHSAFSRLLAQFPHMLLLSTPFLMPGASWRDTAV